MGILTTDIEPQEERASALSGPSPSLNDASNGYIPTGNDLRQFVDCAGPNLGRSPRILLRLVASSAPLAFFCLDSLHRRSKPALVISARHGIACGRPSKPIWIFGDGRMASLAKEGKFQDAQKYYEQALDHDPNQSDALNSLVAVFVRQKQNAKAVERVQQQIAKVPSNDAFYALLEELQAGNKDFPGAEASLQKATSLNKNNLGAFVLFE